MATHISQVETGLEVPDVHLAAPVWGIDPRPTSACQYVGERYLSEYKMCDKDKKKRWLCDANKEHNMVDSQIMLRGCSGTV